jgi:hypothetical protein
MEAALVNLPGIQPFHVVRFSVNCQCGNVTVPENNNVTICRWNRRIFHP